MTTPTRPRSRPALRAPLVLGTALLAGAASVAVPGTAQAAEGVSSSFDAYCSLRPDERPTGESVEPEGVSFEGVQSAGSASPLQHAITGRLTAVYPAGAALSGEDCSNSLDFADRLTVAAGSTGLAAGDTVPVQISVRLDADVSETWDVDGSFETRAEYGVGATVRSLDGCVDGGEVPICDTPLHFSADHEHHVYGGPPNGFNGDGYVQASAFRDHELTTNVGEPGGDNYVDESRPGHVDETDLCATWAGCTPSTLHDPTGPQEFTAEATLVVGHRYQITGSANLFTSAYENADVTATAEIGEFSVRITPAAGYEGVDLGYASAGGGGEVADTVAPEVTADVSPAATGGWHTSPPTVTLTATDAGTGAASITYATSGAVTTAETVVPGDTASLTIGTDGVTEVTYRATDVVGNVSDPQTISVSLDTAAPTLTGLADVTVPATSAAGASVGFTVTATDALTLSPAVTCAPPSGSVFPVGATTVTCTATDAAGNGTTGSFTVTVQALVTDPMDRLGEAIAEATMPRGIRAALTLGHRLAGGAFDAGRTRAGCAILAGMDVLVARQSPAAIPAAEATLLRSLIAEVRAAEGC